MLDGAAVGTENLDIGSIIGVPARLQATAGTPSSWAGPITLVGPTIITGAAGADLTLSGGMFDTGALEVKAPITLHLTTTNVGLDGDLLITGAGATVDNTIGVFSARALTLAGGTLALNGGHASLTALSGSGTVALGNNGSLALNNTVPVSFGGSITGQGVVSKFGAADLTLTGANPFSGLLRITEGRLIVAHAQAHAAADLVVDDGAGAEYQTAASTTRGAALFGSGPGNAGTLRVLGGDVTFGALVTLHGTTRLEVAPARTLTMAAVTSQSALRFGGGGTVEIGASGTELVSVVFGADGLAPGTLRMGGPAALSPQVIDVPAGGTLDLGGFGLDLTGITGAGHIAVRAGTLSLRQATADVAFGGTLSGTGHIFVDIAPHAFRMTGTHTFSGLLQTQGGTYVHRGVLPAAIKTEATAVTFEGDSVVGDLNLQFGDVVVGDGVTPATVRSTALDLVQSTLKLWIHTPAQGTAAAPFTVAGGVRVQSTLELAFTGTAPTESSPVTLIDNTGPSPVEGEFRDLPDGTLVDVGNGVSLLLRYAGGNGNDVTLGAPIATSTIWPKARPAAFFDMDLLIANPHAVGRDRDRHVPAAGRRRSQTITRVIEPMSRVTIAVDDDRRPRKRGVVDDRHIARDHAARGRTHDDAGMRRLRRAHREGHGGRGADAGISRKAKAAEGSSARSCCWRIRRRGGERRDRRVSARRRNAARAHLRSGAAVAPAPSTAADDPELVGRSFGMTVDVRIGPAWPSARCTSARIPMWTRRPRVGWRDERLRRLVARGRRDGRRLRHVHPRGESRRSER